jgi:hypothetical protein
VLDWDTPYPVTTWPEVKSCWQIAGKQAMPEVPMVGVGEPSAQVIHDHPLHSRPLADDLSRPNSEDCLDQLNVRRTVSISKRRQAKEALTKDSKLPLSSQ